jgi:hypothetical protein
MTRTDIINLLAKKINASSYLEIGVRDPSENFNKIICTLKHGVDPHVGPAAYTEGMGYQTYSDIYFDYINKDVFYDIIFIDGLHTEEQVDKDIQGALARLKEGGLIVLHDCNPPNQEFELPHWCGTVWRSIYKLRRDTDYLNISVVDTDYGCGIVRKGTPKPLTTQTEELSYSFLDNNRVEVLNLISISDFVRDLVHD